MTYPNPSDLIKIDPDTDRHIQQQEYATEAVAALVSNVGFFTVLEALRVVARAKFLGGWLEARIVEPKRPAAAPAYDPWGFSDITTDRHGVDPNDIPSPEDYF